MTALTLALLAPDAVDRQLLNGFARWHALFNVLTPVRMEGYRHERGHAWLRWLESKPPDINRPFLVVNAASRLVTARITNNVPKLIEGAIFEVGHRYRLIALDSA